MLATSVRAPRQAAAALCAAAWLAGCYTYSVPGEVGPEVGRTFAFDLTDQGRASLGARIGPGTDRIEGALVGVTDTIKEAAARHPLRYMITWAFSHVLREYVIKVCVLQDGKIVEVDASTGHEKFLFDKLGRNEELECAITPGMASFIFTRPTLKDFAEKTVRWPGHFDGVDVLKSCGMLDLEPVMVDGKAVVPREVLLASIEPRLRALHGTAILSRYPICTAVLKPFAFQPYDWYGSEKGLRPTENGLWAGVRLLGEDLRREMRRGPCARPAPTLYDVGCVVRGTPWLRHWGSRIFMFSKHWPGFILAIAVAVLGSSAAHAQPMAVVADQDFGSVRVANAATSPATRTFDIRNGGTTTLTITSVAVFSMQAADFTITAAPASGTQLLPDETASVTAITALVPVPVSTASVGDAGSSLVIRSRVERAPAAEGSKLTPDTALPPPPIVAP